MWVDIAEKVKVTTRPMAEACISTVLCRGSLVYEQSRAVANSEVAMPWKGMIAHLPRAPRLYGLDADQQCSVSLRLYVLSRERERE